MTLGIGHTSTIIAGLATRRATAADLDGLIAMHQRCSSDSIYQRYLTGGRGPGAAILARLLDPAYARTFVVAAGDASPGGLSPGSSIVGGLSPRGSIVGGLSPRGSIVGGLSPRGSIVASGNLARDGDSVEAALLVEDAWQRQGVGTALFAFLLREAAAAGYATVLLHTHASNLGVQRMIRRAAARGEGPAMWPVHFDGPLLTYLLPLST
jgi:GNAT superfamily N-acetyltransferase